MGSILSFLSSYQIFSSLIPGAIVVTAALWLRGIVVDKEYLAAILAYYFVGLCLNRIGAITAFSMSPRTRRKLWVVYRDLTSSRPVYDTFVMYRTLTVALFALAIFTLLPGGRDLTGPLTKAQLAGISFALALLFGVSAYVQYFYLMEIAGHSPSATNEA